MIALIINGGSGADDSGDTVQEVEAQLRAAGHEVQSTVSKDPAELQQGVDRAMQAEATAIVAGGGDGTVCLVAGKLAGSSIPLGVIPLGTLNHFAKDLGLPLELDQAVEVIIAGHTTRVDVGEVNGRVFINNSSLGLYPAIVRLRERHPARGWRKWPVAVRATLEAMKHQPRMTVRATLDGTERLFETRVFFVGNNAYRAAGFGAASRESLSEGHLAIYVVQAHRRREIVALLWRVLLGSAEDSPVLDVLEVEEAVVETRHQRVTVARDGEVEELTTPLTYRVRPKALVVLVGEAGREERENEEGVGRRE